MAYTKTVWKDYPDTTTKMTAQKLNNIENGIAGVLDWIYPVGTIYETTSTNLDTIAKMATHFGGTWEAYGAGRVLVAKSADTEFDTIGKTGGSKYLQEHDHKSKSNSFITNTYPAVSQVNYQVAGGDNYIDLDSFKETDVAGTGDSGNLQPYIVVYRYRRTA